VNDHEQIRQLVATWARTYDSRDAQGWSALFADNGRFAVDRPERNHVGRAEVRQYAETAFETSPADRKTRHYCASPVIRFTGEDSADVDVDFVVYSARGGDPWALTSVGRYLNKLIREGDKWYFLENLVTHP